ncbi:DNA-binding response regulator, NarL/FixJ family, contains REC and HTH domains [Raineyella antarctica]|uniref:DNA-binding response regulator, NarL/FixJ family, contains REC and HTH domains n=2 Tax=Raineyella antarctica TaxID=1577474 RepID=A0A1G6GX18_9ACTN|nr:DNA-binding response regulator, NarL/FixJ family, contains REC and HTH domains [Raineyella antarctica]
MLVDDDAMVRTGVRALLESDPGLVVVAEASDGDEVVSALHAHHPDVVLMDLHMPRLDGIRATERLLREVNPPKVVALTSIDLDRYVYEALAAGASGFLLKDVRPEQLRAAVRTVHQGDAVLSPRSTNHVLRHFAHSTRRDLVDEAHRLMASLSEKERQVAALVHEGLSNSQIARRLACSEATVKTHLSHVMAKIDAPTRVQVALLVERASPAGGIEG